MALPNIGPQYAGSMATEATLANSTSSYYALAGGGGGNENFGNVNVSGTLNVSGAATLNTTTAQVLAVDGAITQGAGGTASSAVLQTDGLGNAQLTQLAGAAGNGQAYHDLKTNKPVGGQHNFRRMQDSNGDCYLQHYSPAGVQQSMYWNNQGTSMLFNFGATTSLTVAPIGIQTGSIVGNSTQVAFPNSPGPQTITLYSFPAANYAVGKPFTAIVNALAFSGDLSFSTPVNITMQLSNFNNSGLGVIMQGSIIGTPTGLPPNWTVQLTGSGTSTMTLSVTNDVTPIGPGGEFANVNLTAIGAQ